MMEFLLLVAGCWWMIRSEVRRPGSEVAGSVLENWNFEYFYKTTIPLKGL